MASSIQIKRTANADAPSTNVLATSELAYSQDASNDGANAILYIESIDSNNNAVIDKIGGKYYTMMLDNATNLSNANAIVRRDSSGNFKAGTIEARLYGTANAASSANTALRADLATLANVSLSTTFANSATISNTANSWTTPRKITLAGDISGNVTIDGSSNVTLTATVNNLPGDVGNANTALYATLSERANSATVANLANVALYATQAERANIATQANSATVSGFASLANLANSSTTSNYATLAEKANSATIASTANLALTSNFANSAIIANSANVATLANSATLATTANTALTSNFATLAESANSSTLATTANTALTSNFAILANSANIATLANSATIASTANAALTANFANSATIANTSNISLTSHFANSATIANVANVAVSATSANTALTSNFATLANSANIASSANNSINANVAVFATLSNSANIASNANNSINATTSGFSTLAETANISISAIHANSATISNTANTLTTSRKISISGDATGNVMFDGSSNVDISLVVDFANANAANFVAIADTANALTNPFVLSLSGDAFGNVSIDGSANVDINVSIGFAVIAETANTSFTSDFANLAEVSNISVVSNSSVIANSANNSINANVAVFATLANSANIASSSNNSINANVAVFATLSNSANIASNANNAINATVSSYATLAERANSATIANIANISVFATLANSANIASNANVAAFAILAETSNIAVLAINANVAVFAETANVANTANISNVAAYSGQAEHADLADLAVISESSLFANAATSSNFSDTANVAVYANLAEYSNSAIISNTANALTTPRHIILTGHAIGSGQFDGSSNVSISTTVDFSNVIINLGSNTVGDYVNNVIASTGIVITGQGGEGSNIVVLLANTAVTAGTYGGTTEIPVLVVDQQGRLTSVANATISTDLLISGDSGSDTVSSGEILRLVGGSGVSTNVISNTVTITNIGVTRLDGTTNQLEVTSNTGQITISLPSNVIAPGNLTVMGSLNVVGNITTTNFVTITAEDSMLKLANNNSASDTVDIGFYGQYNNAGVKFAGLVRDASDGVFKLFKDTSTEPDNVINFTGISKATLDANLTGGNVSGLFKAITIADGGTGNTTFKANSVIVGNVANPLDSITGTEGQTLQIINGKPGFKTVNEAPANVEFIVGSANVLVPSARVIEGGNNITIDKTIANKLIIKREAITGAVSIPFNSNISTLSSNIVFNTHMGVMAGKSVKLNDRATANTPIDFQLTTASRFLGTNASGNIDMISFNSSFTMTGNTVSLTNGSLLYGTVDPTTEGLDNDFYINKANSYLFGPKASGTWPTGINLKGKPGWEYLFAPSIGNNDPTATKIRFDSATANAMTFMRINKTDLSGNDRTQHITAVVPNGIFDIVSLSSSGTTNLRIKATGNVASINAGAYFNIPVSWIAGGLPGDQEPIAILYTPGPNIQWDSTSQVLRDANGTEISNPLTYTTSNDVPLTANSITNKAAIVQNEGFPYAVYSEGNTINTIGVERLDSYVPTTIRKLILPTTGLTWTVSNNAGTVRLTSSGLVPHGLTTGNAVVSVANVPLVEIKVSSGTGWTANSFHKITGITSTTIDLQTTYTGQGAPTVVAQNTEVEVLNLTLPKLRENTVVALECGIGSTSTISSRRVRCYLNNSILSDINQTSTNRYTPMELGFANQGISNLQRSLHGNNSTGLVTNSLDPVYTNVETKNGNTNLTVAFLIASADTVYELQNYFLYIRG